MGPRGVTPVYNKNLLSLLEVRQPVLASSLARLQGAQETVLRLDTLDAVDAVEVLDANNLEAGGTGLAGGNGSGSQEVLPDLKDIVLANGF